MAPFSRRAFLRNTAWATAGVVTFPYLAKSWYALAAADAPGYFAREFGITDALCRKILAAALSKGGDYAELYFEHTVRNWLALEDGQVNQAYSQVDLGVGIRTVKGDQIGYGYTQQLAEGPMLAAAAIFMVVLLLSAAAAIIVAAVGAASFAKGCLMSHLFRPGIRPQEAPLRLPIS